MSADGVAAPLGVAVFGTGRAGTEIVRSCGYRSDLRLVVGVAVTEEKDGSDLGLITVGEANGVAVTCDLDAALAREDVDVVLHAGLGGPQAVGALLGRCADAGKDAITVSGLVHPAAALGEEMARGLDRRARAGGSRLLGTGVNPGFVLDVLPVICGSMASRIDRLHARRVSDCRNWGAGALDDDVGLGLRPDDERRPSALSLSESLELVADALDLRLEAREEVHEALISSVVRAHGGRIVQPGETVGFRKRAVGHRRGDVVVEIEWCAIFCLDPAEDGLEESASVTVDGDVTMRMSASGSFFGDPYPSTAARALNAIRPLRDLPPGLYRPDQLPGAPRCR